MDIRRIAIYLIPLLAMTPIGGHKGSGWGRSNHKWGLNQYLQTQVIHLPSNPEFKRMGKI